MNIVPSLRPSFVVSLVSLVGALLAGATGCASMGTGTTTVYSRATRFGAFPIDVQISQTAGPGHAPVVTATGGYGFAGG